MWKLNFMINNFKVQILYFRVT